MIQMDNEKETLANLIYISEIGSKIELKKNKCLEFSAVWSFQKRLLKNSFIFTVIMSREPAFNVTVTITVILLNTRI